MSEPIEASPFTFTAADGHELYVYRWLPPAGTPVRAIVQVVHGAAEHAGRYERLAKILAAEGYAVYADDHVGHGKTAGSVERAGIVEPGAWDRMVDDERQLIEHARSQHPGVPVVFLGHSMGSMIGQTYVQRFGGTIDGLILSGSASSMQEGGEDLVERVEAALQADGPEAPSMDFAMLFAGFNEPFNDNAPGGEPTGFEWLSRDPAEVQLYLDDPFCGFMFSNQLVLDMGRGLRATWAEGAEASVPATLPVLLIAGAEDPVGANDSVHNLGERYRAVGLDVTEALYPGARHEIFNETNRDEAHAAVVAWLDTHVPKP